MSNPDTVGTAEDFETLLPEGWSGAEGADIFDPSTWGDGGSADAQDADGADGEEITAEGTDDQTRTTEEDTEPQTDSDADNGDPTTVEDQPSGKLRFKASIDHSEQDVELDPSELPSIYQKARALDRYQNRVNEHEAELNAWDSVAKSLGYESRKDMMNGAVDNAVQSYIDEHPGVPEDMARDYISRKFNLSRTESAPAEAKDGTVDRDFKKEVADLFRAYPTAHERPVPNEVTNDALVNSKPLVQAYAEYMARTSSAKAKNAERENKILKQNQAAAAKAPVSKVTGGGKTDSKPDDDFLTGFNSDTW